MPRVARSARAAQAPHLPCVGSSCGPPWSFMALDLPQQSRRSMPLRRPADREPHPNKDDFHPHNPFQSERSGMPPGLRGAGVGRRRHPGKDSQLMVEDAWNQDGSAATSWRERPHGIGSRRLRTVSISPMSVSTALSRTARWPAPIGSRVVPDLIDARLQLGQHQRVRRVRWRCRL